MLGTILNTDLSTHSVVCTTQANSSKVIMKYSYFSPVEVYNIEWILDVLCRDKDAEIERGLVDLIRRLKKTNTDLFSSKKVCRQYRFSSNI